MTVVLSLWFLSRCTIIADSRISYPEEVRPPRDLLQKIYPIGSSNLGIKGVIGFSGTLSDVYTILHHVREEVKSMDQPGNTHEFISMIVKPLKDKFQLLDMKDRKQLSFMVVGVEPTKDISHNRPSWVPFTPEFQGCILKSDSKDPTILHEEPLKLVNVIGSYDQELLDYCTQLIENYINLSYKDPSLFSHIVRYDLMKHYMLKQNRYVGGLFQLAELSVDGVRMMDYSSAGGISLRWEENRYFYYENSKVREPLITIFDRVDWSRGRFFPLGKEIEDPLIRSEINILIGGK